MLVSYMVGSEKVFMKTSFAVKLFDVIYNAAVDAKTEKTIGNVTSVVGSETKYWNMGNFHKITAKTQKAYLLVIAIWSFVIDMS